MFFGWFFGDEVFWVMGVKGEFFRMVYVYFKVVFLFYFIRFVGFIFFLVLRGVGDMKIFMKFGIFMNVVNVIFDYFLIYGKFGFLRMGVVGVVWVLGIGIMFLFLIGLYFFLSGKFVFKFRLSWSFYLEMVVRILRIGIFILVECGFFSFYNFFYMSIVICFGDVVLVVY